MLQMVSISKEKVRFQMKQKGILTQKELAEKLKISDSQLSMLLSSKYSPVKSNVLKMCVILDIKFEDIINSETDNELENRNNKKMRNKKKQNNSTDFTEVRGVKPNK